MAPIGLPLSKPPRRRRLNLYPGINTRIIAPFLFVTLVIASIGMFLITRLVAGSLQERLTNQLVDSATAATNKLVDLETQQLASLRVMTLTDGVPDAIQTRNTANLESWLSPLAANARVDSAVVFDATGQGLLQISRVVAEGSSISYSATDTPYLGDWTGVQSVIKAQSDTLGDKFVDIVRQPSPNSPIIYISASVRNAAGQVVGGISVGMQGDHLAQQASNQALSEVILIGNDGLLVGNAFKAPLEKVTQVVKEGASLQQMVLTTKPIRDLDVDGQPYQVLYAPFTERSQSYGVLAVALPSNLILDRSGFGRDIFGVLFSILVVAVALMGVVTARTITRPVQHLVAVTRAIRSGDLSRRAMLHIPDELGELGTSLDEMTDALVQQNTQINAQYVQQLRETAQRDAILGGIADAVIVQDIAGRLILRNTSADLLVEAISASAAARTEFKTLCAHPERFLEPHTQPVNLTGRFFSVIATTINAPAAESAGQSIEQKPLGYVLVFRDVTPLLEAERLKEQLILQMSHELRTPLTAARGYIDLVKMIDAAALSEQSRTFLDNSTDNLTTLERLINQVIDVSTIISGRFTLDLDTFVLQPLLEELVSAWRGAVNERQQTLALHTPLEPIQIYADRQRLSEVIDHLLRNATSYTLPTGVLELAAHTENGDTLILTVSDTGVGIGADEIDKVFEQLYRGRSADAGLTDVRGMGLGLYLSRRIVEAHHGQITLTSTLNKGTRVTVRLPLQVTPTPDTMSMTDLLLEGENTVHV